MKTQSSQVCSPTATHRPEPWLVSEGQQKPVHFWVWNQFILNCRTRQPTDGSTQTVGAGRCQDPIRGELLQPLSKSDLENWNYAAMVISYRKREKWFWNSRKEAGSLTGEMISIKRLESCGRSMGLCSLRSVGGSWRILMKHQGSEVTIGSDQ